MDAKLSTTKEKKAVLPQHETEDDKDTPGVSSHFPNNESPKKNPPVETPQKMNPASAASDKETNELDELVLTTCDVKFYERKVSNPVTGSELERELSENENLYKRANALWQRNHTCPQEYLLARFTGIIEKVNTAYRYFRQRIANSPKLRKEYSGQLGERLVKSGLATSLCDVAVEIIEKELCSKKDLGPLYTQLLDLTLTSLSNFTDWNPPVAKCVRCHEKLLPTLLCKLDGLFPALQFKSLMPLSIGETIVRSSMTIIHNVDLDDENVPHVREIPGILNVLNKYADRDDHDIYRFLAMLCIADLVTDENRDQLTAPAEIIYTLVATLQKALESKNHTAIVGGNSVDVNELVRAVKHLARNDENKTLMVKQGALPVLTAGLRSDYKEEKKGCMECLWWLSFNEEVREKMMEETELLDLVEKIYRDKDDECQEAADGMLFQLREVLQRRNTKKGPTELGNTLMRNGDTGRTSVPQKHVMLSYSQKYSEVVTEICKFLQQHNIPVWMDTLHMADAEGSISRAMAEAVEHSEVFLLCYSESYSNSQYCEQEAQYANDLQKFIIPVKLQAGYKPTGWLGFIISGKFFFDFTKEDQRKQKLEKLLEKIQARYTKSSPDEVDARAAIVKTQEGATLMAESSHGAGVQSVPQTHAVDLSVKEKVNKWTQEDVLKWMQHFRLTGEKIQNLTGTEIAYLYQLKSETPTSFHELLKSQLHLETVSDLARFVAALEKINEML